MMRFHERLMVFELWIAQKLASISNVDPEDGGVFLQLGYIAGMLRATFLMFGATLIADIIYISIHGF